MTRFILSAFVVGAGIVLAVPALAQSPRGDAARGKQIFMTDGCYECHGTRGAGGGFTGPRLAPNPPSFAAVKAQLRHPARRMPPYTAKVISDAQIADIYAYLKSIPAGRPASQIPLLNQ